MRKIIETKKVENIEEWERKVDEFNKKRGFNEVNIPYLFVDMGKLSVYYTLWHVWEYESTLGLQNMWKYRGNLSMKIDEAVQKAMEIAERKNLPLCLYCGEETKKYKIDNSEDIFHWGKYAGRNIFDVALNDVGYVKYMKNWLLERKHPKPSQFRGYMKFSQKMQTTLDKCEEAISFFYEKVTEENRKNSKCEYIANDGEKVKEITIVVSKIKQATGFDGEKQIQLYCNDEKQNNIVLYINENTKNYREYNEGKKMKASGIVKNYERLGIKYSRIKNAKLQTI